MLINKLDIKDEAALATVEAEIVSARFAEWSATPFVKTFDFSHYKAIHAHLFSDLLMFATIQAAQGVTDLLKQLLGEAVRPQE